MTAAKKRLRIESVPLGTLGPFVKSRVGGISLGMGAGHSQHLRLGGKVVDGMFSELDDLGDSFPTGTGSLDTHTSQSSMCN